MKYKLPKLVRKKLEKKEAVIKSLKVFSIEGALFLITSILSIVGAFHLNNLSKAQKIYLPTTSLQDFLFSFLVATIVILFFVSLKKHNKFKEIIYKTLFILTVFWGGMTILSLWLPVFLAIFIMGVLIMLWIKKQTILIHDIVISLGLSGAAAFLGLSFSPETMVILLIVFSFYDFIAVYKTKHMIEMAKDMIEKKVIIGFIIPKDISHFNESLNEVKKNKSIKVKGDKKLSNLGNFFILGGGDVVFPSLLAVSLVPEGFFKALIVVIFGLIGSLASYLLFINQKDKEPLPALPPIALLSIIGYLITLLF